MLHILALLALFTFCNNALSQPPIGWSNRINFGGTGTWDKEWSSCIITLEDTSALIFGVHGPNNSRHNWEMFCLNVDQYGQLERDSIPLLGRYPQEGLVDQNGDVILVGAHYLTNDTSGWIGRFTTDGDFIDQRSGVTPNSPANLADIIELSNGNYLCVGWTVIRNGEAIPPVPFIVELDPNFNTVRDTIVQDLISALRCVDLFSNGDFVVGGWKNSNGRTHTLARYDSSWNNIWSLEYSNPHGGVIQDIATKIEDEIFWVGYQNVTQDGLTGETWGDGSERWVREFNEWNGDLEKLSNDRFIIAGRGYVRSLDSEGELLWSIQLTPNPSIVEATPSALNDDFVDLAVDVDGGVWVSYSTSSNTCFSRICPEDCDVLEPEIIVQGPPVWGMRFHEVHGHARELIFPKVKDATRAWATGAAAKKWTAEIHNYGVWDSVVFRGTQPVNGSIDTIWFSCSPYQYEQEWVSDCKVDTISVLSSGTVILVSEKVNESGFRVRADQANVIEVVFSELPTGSTGRVSGAAASTWNAMPNGDGNDGDSVIFNQLASRVDSPLHAGQSIDTFWIQTPSQDCFCRWRAGNASSSQMWLPANLQDLTFRGENYGYGTEIRLFIEANNEWGVNRYEIYGKAWNNTLHLLHTFTPANDSSFHQYVFSDTTGKGRYLLNVNVSGGCERLLTERELIVGVNVPINDGLPSLPTELSLAAYPNPFNGTLSISLNVPLHQEATVALYDLLGREVDMISRGELAGSTFSYSTPPHLASGIYFIRATTGSEMQLQKVVLLK